ncbi:nucleotidyltransferase domain-containing protein [Rossellomorea sp. y25]|uniref:nucleotidyltransferase domain-containing protein n=1 Tax=Rossellomorea sp. y25 TaxID=3118174 RepID=UPI0030E31250
MRRIILDDLRCIEREEEIKILYAVEAGSRAWGYHIDDSDYDVRFIYIRETTAYLNLQQTKDVIVKSTHHAIEFGGWDLSKALKLLRKSNPSLLEWLTDENVYIEHPTIEKIRKLRDQTFSPDRCLIHYYHMTKRNMEKCLKDDPNGTKKWMTIIRPWLACKWIMKYQTFPPNGINQMIDHLNMYEDIKNTIISMVTSRVKGKEAHHLKHMEEYLKEDLLKMDRALENLHSDHSYQWGGINETFISILEEVWGMQLDGKKR